MISQAHKKGLFVDQVAEIMTTTGESVLTTQNRIARKDYKRRTGKLTRGLAAKPYRIANRSSNPSLVIDYPIHIRFLDMKYTKRGLPKKNYSPIYNRQLYGFIFGYAYKQLRWGLADTIRDNFTGPLETALNNPIWL
ncbi:hypothetical protein DMA11_10380 [Marinilabiliaceae bacterium JC017]|nr:hypothetical protein DMA11_10380 [Marinilabiliaceae bacterium JC017]